MKQIIQFTLAELWNKNHCRNKINITFLLLEIVPKTLGYYTSGDFQDITELSFICQYYDKPLLDYIRQVKEAEKAQNQNNEQ